VTSTTTIPTTVTTTITIPTTVTTTLTDTTTQTVTLTETVTSTVFTTSTTDTSTTITTSTGGCGNTCPPPVPEFSLGLAPLLLLAIPMLFFFRKRFVSLPGA